MEVFLMIIQQFCFFLPLLVEIIQLNSILTNVFTGVITCIVQEMIALAVENTIMYIRKNAVQLLTIIPFPYTVYRIRLF